MNSLTTSYDFVSHLTRFCRTLRLHGFLIGPEETADAVRAVEVVGAMDQGRVYWTLRGLLASRRADLDVFDDLFQRFWDFQPPPPKRPDLKKGMSQAGGMREFRRRPGTLVLPEADLRRSEDTVVQVQRTGASATEMISDTQLTALASDETAIIARIAARVVRALASRPGRRRKRHKRKGTPDLRGAFRLNMATGGDLIRLPRMRRVPRVPRLLVLLDVSGSMDRHTRLLLQLVYAVSQHTRRIETFVFSTSVTRVTRQLKAPSFAEALGRVSMLVDHWSGGTRIGECLGRINADHRALEDRHTTVLLLSDGWETGETGDLADEMRRMQRRVKRVVWLDPLLGTDDFQPISGGLRAVTPYVDHFIPAAEVSDLRRLPALLRG